MTAGRLDQRANPETGSGTENHLRARSAETDRTDRPRPALRDRRQRQGLRLEIVEQQPLGEAEPPRRLGAVHHPRRIGELEPAPVDRPGAADENRTRPRAERSDRRLGGFDQPGIVVGLEMNCGAEWRIRRPLQSEAGVGAADVDDDDRERYDEIAHGEAINAASRARRQGGGEGNLVAGPAAAITQLAHGDAIDSTALKQFLFNS